MIKLIAMDFDRTFIKYNADGYEINGQLVRYLNAFIRDGGLAGIVSGRGPGDMERMFADKGVPWGHEFPNFFVQCEAFVYHQTDGIVTPDEGHNAAIGKTIDSAMRTAAGCLGRWLPLLEKNGLPLYAWHVSSRFAAELQCYGETAAQQAMELIRADLTARGIRELEAVRNGVSVTVSASAAGKGNTLAYVADSRHIAPCEVLAVGDSLNDLSMTDGSRGFIGGAVGNAAPQLRRAVQDGGGLLTEKEAGDGVLDIIRQAAAAGALDDYGLLGEMRIA